jgi:transcriptional regulator with XRE-family HTH domain
MPTAHTSQDRGRRNPLRSWRKKHHVSQAQLAHKLDVHYTLVSQWEQGRCIPNLTNFNQLLDHTGIPVLPLLRFFVGNSSRGGVTQRV